MKPIKNKPTSKLNNFRVYFKPVNGGNEEKTYLEFDKWRDLLSFRMNLRFLKKKRLI